VFEIIVAPPQMLGGAGGGGSGLVVLRTLRLLRLVQLMGRSGGLREVLQITMALMRSAASFGVLLLICMFILALLGMQLFANRLRFDGDGYPVGWTDIAAYAASSKADNANFDDIWSAVVTVMQVSLPSSVSRPCLTRPCSDGRCSPGRTGIWSCMT
jgi:hypothetical protein